MGTITISVTDDVETTFRVAVKKEYGEGKGTLGKAISEALLKWTEEKSQRNIAQEMKHFMDKGFFMGKNLYKARAELHER